MAAAAAARVCVAAPAKINLALAVLGRRGDGYHEVRTLYQAVGLCDRVAIRPARSGVRVSCPSLPGLGERNLAHRAAALFLERTGVRAGVRVQLEKRIPAGGGLGGGSSDAAAVLLGCCRLFGVRPARAELAQWAAALGSDVPFFLDGGAAVGSGRGEVLEGLPPLAGGAVALIHIPPQGLSTAAVYGALRPEALTRDESALTILLAQWRRGRAGLKGLGAALFNDLEEPAFALAPGLEAAKQQFRAAGALGALLCGSGSSVFGLFDGGRAADAAVRRLRGRLPGRLVKAAFLTPRRRWGVVKR